MRGASWIAGIGLAVAACVVTAVTPQSHLVYSTNATKMPFDLPMTLGETTTGRTFSARPEAVRAARSIEREDGTVEGTFVIVDLVIDSTGVEPDTSLAGIQLEAGGRTYYPTERVDGTLASAQPRAGLPLRGSIVFELPADAIRGHGQLRLANAFEVRFDDRLVLDMDLDDVTVSASERVEEAGWAR